MSMMEFKNFNNDIRTEISEPVVGARKSQLQPTLKNFDDESEKSLNDSINETVKKV